jgi:hypothetical protein
MLERVTRIELAFSAWEADVLPLNYTRMGAAAYPKAPLAPLSGERSRVGWPIAAEEGIHGIEQP